MAMNKFMSKFVFIMMEMVQRNPALMRPASLWMVTMVLGLDVDGMVCPQDGEDVGDSREDARPAGRGPNHGC